MLAVMLIAIFSCSSLRHYKKVANDIPRNEAKRNILAPICANEFPIKEKTDTVIEYTAIADTVKEQYLKYIIKQLQKQLEQQPECPQIDVDSLYDAIIKAIPTDTIVKIKTITKVIEDSSKLQLADNKYNGLLANYYKLDALYIDTDKQLKQLQQDVNSNSFLLKKLFKKNWYWLLLIVAVIGGYWYLSKMNVFKNIFSKIKV